MVLAALAIQQHPLQCPLVQVGDLPEQAHPVAVLEIQQTVQAPMDVVGQIDDLLPQIIGVEAA